MKEPRLIEKEELYKHLPSIWPDNSLRTQIASSLAHNRRCVIALDDDPTGTQTPYARDPVFGYSHSWLPAWVEEKIN